MTHLLSDNSKEYFIKHFRDDIDPPKDDDEEKGRMPEGQLNKYGGTIYKTWCKIEKYITAHMTKMTIELHVNVSRWGSFMIMHDDGWDKEAIEDMVVYLIEKIKEEPEVKVRVVAFRPVSKEKTFS